MSIGEIEDYRYYWQSDWKVGNPLVIENEDPNWEGNYYVRYWETDWKNIIFGNDNSYLKKILDETYHSLEQNFAKIIRDGIDEGLWDDTVSINNLSSLYMGIPLAMNIELSLQQGYIREENYCMSMLELLKRVLRKKSR